MRNKKDGMDGMVDRLQARKTGFCFFFDCIIAVILLLVAQRVVKRSFGAKLFKVR